MMMGRPIAWSQPRTLFSFLSAVSLLVLFGCGVNLGPEQQAPETQLYTLEYPAPEPTRSPSNRHVLRIETVEAIPFYRTQQIVYKEDPFRRETYRYHKWQASPGEMVTYLLLRDFRATEMFKAVLSPNSLLAPSHSLEGEIEDFFEENTDRVWIAVLTLNATLTSEDSPGKGRSVLFQNTYSEREPLTGKCPRALSEAMSRAMSRISTQIIGDVQSALSWSNGMN